MGEPSKYGAFYRLYPTPDGVMPMPSCCAPIGMLDDGGYLVQYFKPRVRVRGGRLVMLAEDRPPTIFSRSQSEWCG